MDIGILGAGALGQAIAIRVAKAGLCAVICNSRDPASLTEVVRSLGPCVSAGTRDDVVQPEIVFLAVPWRSVPDVLCDLPEWNGRILVDATNRSHSLDFSIPNGPGTNSSEVVARLAPTSRLVKAFNTLKPEILATDPHEHNGRRVIFYSGDHGPSKVEISRLISRLGFSGVDLGGLAEGGRLQQYPDGPLVFLNLIKLA
jgi:8-hydroxy-5-deazaflavin:NADPH oxidoreductase